MTTPEPTLNQTPKEEKPPSSKEEHNWRIIVATIIAKINEVRNALKKWRSDKKSKNKSSKHVPRVGE